MFCVGPNRAPPQSAILALPRMRTLDRYVIRETVMPFLLALTVLTFLFAVQPMMLQAQDLLTKGAPLGTVVYLLVNLLPQALGVTLPMAFLIGILIALGRLSSDRETVALLACGVSLWRMLRPALIMATVVGLATMYVMIEAIPAGNKTFIQVTMSLLTQRSAQEIKPGVFYEGFPGKVLYVASVRQDGTWEKVSLATTRDQGLPTLVLADEGRLIMDREQGRVELILEGHVSTRSPGKEAGVYDAADNGQSVRYTINPQDVFPKIDIIPGIHEMTIAELLVEQADEIKRGDSTHPTVIAIHQKFSFPVACLVMGLLGVAVGIHTRKDGKFASFALGLALIFVYYGLMTVFESLAKGQQFPAAWARWMPNLMLGPGALAMIWWRTGNAERSVSLKMPPRMAAWFSAFNPTQPMRESSGQKPVLVIRMPDIGLPRPKLIDLYVMRQYIHVVSLAFVGLLGLFYIGTIVDLSDKLFKSTASASLLFDFLWYSTPQYVYYLIPIAILVAVLVTIGSLSKTSELTVLRACGVSLYRLAGPLLLFAAIWSGVLFGLEEYVMAASNKKAAAIDGQIRGKPASTVDLTSRHWLVGTEGRFYYYAGYDSKHRAFAGLSVYEISAEPFRISRHTYVDRARLTKSGWTGGPGWTQLFPENGGTKRDDFKNRPLRLDPAKYFETEQADALAMTVTQLQTYVKQLKDNGLSASGYEVGLQRKIAFPLMTLVMTLIALPFGVTTGKRGALYGIGLAIALSFAYQIAFTAFGFLGSAELLPATLAAWAPNLLFLAGALYLLLTVRT